MVLQIIRSLFILGILALIFSSTSSCYYDKEELLYPDTVACDTSNVEYLQEIDPILEMNCLGCHSNVQSQTAGAGISLEGHANLKAYVDNNRDRLLGSVKHEAGYSPMPKGGAQLSDCEIAKLEAWINQGAQNN